MGCWYHSIQKAVATDALGCILTPVWDAKWKSWIGEDNASIQVLSIRDPVFGPATQEFAVDRAFVTSPFVHLELVPKAIFHKKRLESAFYEEYFNAAEWFRDLDRIVATAQTEAAKSGLAAMDALHLAAASLSRADEFVTTERPGKPIYRSSLLEIVHLFG
jgi:hypothetical protein